MANDKSRGEEQHIMSKASPDPPCGKFETIDQYIAAQREEIRPVLRAIRKVIASAAPEATERMSWQMPTFWQTENLIHFAAFKNHISIFPGGDATAAFAGRLSPYKTSKGTIRLPLNKPVPYDLIEEITRWRVARVKGDRHNNRDSGPP